MSDRGPELLFLAPGDVRKARVEPISWMRTCHAFALRGLDVTLASVRMRYPDAVPIREVWEHFSVPPSFRIRQLPTPLSRDSSGRAFQAWGALVAGALAVKTMLAAVLRRRRRIVYSRSPILLAPFSILRRALPGGVRPTLVFEMHSLPPSNTWRILRSADLVVVNSRKLEQHASTKAGVSSERVLYAPLPPYGHIEPRPKNQAREELGLPAESRLVCHTGKLVRTDASFMLEIASRARDRIPAFQLMLVGGNPDILEWMHEEVAARGLEGQVLLPGFVDPAKVSTYQSAADVLLLYLDPGITTWEYCTPAKGYDYQAAGRPIVTCNVPLFEEIFGNDGERAIRVKEDTPDAFAEALEAAFSPGHDGAGMGERAMSWIADRSWQSRADAVLDALNPGSKP